MPPETTPGVIKEEIGSITKGIASVRNNINALKSSSNGSNGGQGGGTTDETEEEKQKREEREALEERGFYDED
jgi:hypothetical protein